MAELKISDLYALSALKSQGIEPSGVSQEGGRAVWLFTATNDVRTVLEAFYGRSLPVDALTFGEQIRTSKAEAMHMRAM